MKKILVFLLSLCLLVSATAMVACSKDSGDLTKEDYATAFGAATATCKQHKLDVASAGGFSVSDSELIPAPNNAGVINATIWFMDFLKNVCETESFVLTTDYVEGEIDGITGNGGTEKYFVRFKMNYDKENKIINSEVYCLQPIDNHSIHMYLNFEVVYDFDSSTLTSFVTKGAMGAVDTSDVMYLNYKNNELFMLDTQSASYQTISTEILAIYATEIAKTFGENLPNYSEQYNSANPYLNQGA